MSSSDCIEHSEVIDPHTGTIVCVDCCRVIGDGLTHFEMNLQKYSTFQENLKDEEEKKAESLRTFVHSDNPEAIQTSQIERGQKPLLSAV